MSRLDLAKYRLEVAREKLEAAKLLKSNGFLKTPFPDHTTPFSQAPVRCWL